MPYAPSHSTGTVLSGRRSRLIGDYDDSAALHSHAADIVKRSLGKEHPTFALCQAASADVLANKGKLDEAEAMYRKAMKVQKLAEVSEDSPDIANVANSHAECLRLRGNVELAFQEFTTVLDHRKMLYETKMRHTWRL